MAPLCAGRLEKELHKEPHRWGQWQEQSGELLVLCLHLPTAIMYNSIKAKYYQGYILTKDIQAHPSLEPRKRKRNTWSRQCALRHEGSIFSKRKRSSAHKANHRSKYFNVDSKRLFERNPLCLARPRQAPKWRIVSTTNQKGDYIRWESGYVYVRQGSSDISCYYDWTGY